VARNYRKQKGTEREHRSMALLEAVGYRCIRAGGSLGVFDICGISREGIVLVQVKSRDWPGTAEMEAIKDFPVPPFARKMVHRWKDYQRMPDVKEV
jgi:Holliday junction resolvase